MSDYASRQRDPRKHIVGISLVVLFHLILAWAISNGLAQKFVKIVKGPVQATLLEEQKPDIPPPPPPPQTKDAPPPPPPPPAYVPPADVQFDAPASTNAIAAVSAAPPPAAPPAPPAPTPAPAPPPAPAQVARTPAIANASACEKPAYPPASRRAEEEGTVVLNFLVDVDGKVLDSKVDASSGFKRLDEAARSALSRCLFKPATANGQPEQGWASLKYTWRLE